MTMMSMTRHWRGTSSILHTQANGLSVSHPEMFLEIINKLANLGNKDLRFKIKISKITISVGLLVLLSEKFKVKSSLTNMDSR